MLPASAEQLTASLLTHHSMIAVLNISNDQTITGVNTWFYQNQAWLRDIVKVSADFEFGIYLVSIEDWTYGICIPWFEHDESSSVISGPFEHELGIWAEGIYNEQNRNEVSV